jgi:hypothetical protein
MRRSEIETELRGRAARYLEQRRLFVDYYRIRQRVSFPWPTDALPQADFAVRDFENYIWHVWYAWAVEERINGLGWWGEFSGDEKVRTKTRDELLHLARWPRHFGNGGADVPGLWMSHFLRTLLAAKRNWSWLGEEVAAEIVGACRRGLEQKQAWLAADVMKYQSPEQITQGGLYQSTQITKNIPLISALVMHSAAIVAGERGAAAMLEPHVHAMLKVHLDIASQGMSEGIAYDGYVLDFMADWLMTPGLSPELKALGDHAAVADRLAMPLDLAAPGDVLNVANLSDVEPQEMTFYVSGIAKVAGMRGLTPEVNWHLGNCRLNWLRADALGCMHGLPEEACDAPAAGPRRGLYTLTLRSGWEAEDVAVVMSASRSLHHHVHYDAGTIMIGHRGVWLVADPGYQQYLPRKERDFSIGDAAHNCPVINGVAQSEKGAVALAAETQNGVQHMAVDMTRCYSPGAKLQRAVRHAWLLGKGTIAVCDVIEGEVERVTYHWHGLPEAAWWAENGKALIAHDNAELWIACTAARLEQGMIGRRAGSRGHATLIVDVPIKQRRTSCWWIFSLDRAATWQARDDRLVVEGRELTAG